MKDINSHRDSLEKRGKMRKTFILLGLVIILDLLLSAHYVSAYEEYKPYLHKPSVGNVPKLETFGQYTT